MPGAIAPNLHLGSQSEILADYFFALFGPVTPVRRADDYGLDLYCALAERVGNRSWAREYFSVQVKSNPDPWVMEGEEVRWLFENPNPVLLSVVNKAAGQIEVFHTFGRFAQPPGMLPATLVLCPGCGSEGRFLEWKGSADVDLSAPILRASIAEFFEDAKQDRFRSVLTQWLLIERLNLDYRRMGVARFRMPPVYSTNVVPSKGLGEMGWYANNVREISLGVRRLAEAAQCISDQLHKLGDAKAAVRAALLVDHLQMTHAIAFQGKLEWGHRVPGLCFTKLVEQLKFAEDPNYLYAGLDVVQKALDEIPRVAKALSASP